MSGEIGRIWVSIGARIDGLTKATTDVEKATQKIGKQLQGIGKGMTLAGAAVTGALALIVKQTADFGDQLNDLRQRTGVAADVLSSFKLAADKSGTSLEGVAQGLKFLGRNMAEAASGSKEISAAFKSIGVSVTDAAGKLRPMDEVMLDVADKFAGMEDGAGKTALAMQLFGRAGTDLIPMLNLGRSGLSEMRAEAARLGQVMTNEDAKAADEFNDALVSLKASLGGAFRNVATALMPVIQQLAEKITAIVAKVSEWAREHPGLTQALTMAVAAVGAFNLALGPVVTAAGTLLKILPAIKLAVTALISPFGLAAAGIAGLGLAIWQLVKNHNAALDAMTRAAALAAADTKTNMLAISGVQLRASAEGGEALKQWGEIAFRFGQDFRAAFVEITTNPAYGRLKEILDEITAGLKTTAQSGADLSGVVIQTGSNLKEFTRIVETAIPPAKTFAAVWTSLGETPLPLPNPQHIALLNGALDNFGAKAKQTLENTRSYLDQFTDGLRTSWASAFSDAFQSLFGFTEAERDRLNDLKGALADLSAAYKSGEISLEEYSEKYQDIHKEMSDITNKFAKFWKGIWSSIKTQFFDMLGQMVARFFADFVSAILRGMNIIKAATSAWGAAFGSAGAGAVGASGAGAVGSTISNTGQVISGAGAVGAGSAIGSAITAGFLAIWAPMFIQGIIGAFSWNKPKSPEQLAAERAWIASLTPRQQSKVNWWMEDAAPGNRGNIQMYFHGPIVQTTGLTQQDCYRASEYIFNAVESAGRRRGR